MSSLAGLVLLGLSLLPETASAAGKWTAVHGRVDVVAAGVERRARAGETLAVGDLLESGGDGAAQLLFTDESVMTVAPDTSVRILQYAFDPGSGRRTAVVKVLAGKARFSVAARKNSRFTVESPHAAVTVAAADFVTLAATASTTVAVLDGNASVKNRSNLIVAATELHANQEATVTAKSAPSPPAQITPQQRKAYRADALLAR